MVNDVNTVTEMASLQRKITKQKEELTKAYQRLAVQKQSIKRLCVIRDEAKELLMYVKGMEAMNTVKQPTVHWKTLEVELLGWDE